MNYAAYQVVSICILSTLVGGLGLVVRLCARLCVCYAGIFGVGAFVAALLMTRGGCGFLPAVLLAGSLSGCLALALGAWSLRLLGEQYMLATLAVQAVLTAVLYNSINLTGGPSGISGIPRPSIPIFLTGAAPVKGASAMWTRAESTGQFLWIVVPICCLSLAVVAQIWRSPFGRRLQAVRDDELAASALGKNPVGSRVAAFTVAGVLAGVAGAVFASFHSYIDATSFGVEESIFLLSVVALGAPSRIIGPIVAGASMTLLIEVLRFLAPSWPNIAHVREVLLGAALIIMARVPRHEPKGSVSHG